MNHQLEEIKYIPFLSSKKKVYRMYINIIKKNILIDNKYKNITITPVYIPCNCYSYDINGFINLKCSKDSIWKSQNYKYIKSDIYKVNREANGKIENVVVCCSKEIDNQKLINSYNYKKLIELDKDKILNYKICKGDKTKASIKNLSIEKTKEIFKNDIKDRLLGYDLIEEEKSSVLLNNECINHILLPVWIIEVKNSSEKIYINGQNNKIIYKFKLSWYRIFIIWIIMFVLTLITLFLFKYLR